MATEPGLDADVHSSRLYSPLKRCFITPVALFCLNQTFQPSLSQRCDCNFHRQDCRTSDLQLYGGRTKERVHLSLNTREARRAHAHTHCKPMSTVVYCASGATTHNLQPLLPMETRERVCLHVTLTLDTRSGRFRQSAVSGPNR